MPGVPSGRGCDACRKQKKKCDQSKPSCARCTRLNIPCIGSGQQRYKFLHEDGSSSCPNTLPTRLSRKSTSSSSSASRASRSLSRTPSNDDTLLTNILISKLTARDDLRYHLTWAYGPFFEDIPKRLGHNPALDTAVHALLSAHTTHAVTKGGRADQDSLTKYTHAVKTLRICLNTPAKAREANTLCAVYLLMICHLYLGAEYQNDSAASHTEGAAILLRARGYYNAEDEFEKKLVQTLRGAVLFEFLINHKSKTVWSLEEWHRTVISELDRSHPAGDMMRRLADVPDLMRRGRLAVLSNFLPAHETSALISEIRIHYDAVGNVLAGLRQEYDKVRHLPRTTTLETRIHNMHQRMFAFALAGHLVFNCLLKALGDLERELEIQNDALDHCHQILILTDEARIYRPLGASWMPLFITVAYAAAPDEGIKSLLADHMTDYSADFPLTREENMRAALDDSARKLLLQVS